MSALTDLFTALANAIRSKTGGSDTYTPLEMVSDGIDDVYDAGVAAGETTHTETYTPATNTAANDMGVIHDYRYVNTSGMIIPSGNKAITANGTGIDVANYATASVAVPEPTLTGDAAVGNVLSGKTFYNNSLTRQAGTMTNNGAVSQALNCGGSYTIPEGYHNGNGTVSANSLASQTGVDSGKTAIDASHVHSGYQGWVNGNKISGSYTEPTIQSITPNTADAPSMMAGENYNPTQNGYAVTTKPSVKTPSDTPQYSDEGDVVAFSSYGCIVKDVFPRTPSASGITLYNGKIYRMAADGYVYNTQRKRTYMGTASTSTSGRWSVDCGFKPGYICMFNTAQTSQGIIYDKDWSTTKGRMLNSGGNQDFNLGGSTNNQLYSIDSTGFTMNKTASARTYTIFAIEE